MGLFRRKKVPSDAETRAEFVRISRLICDSVEQHVDGSNASERRLLEKAAQLRALTNSNAAWQAIVAVLLVVCEDALQSLDFSTDGERQLYVDAMGIVKQFADAGFYDRV